ncbi:scavenger mRNA decapping enzyme [Dacryopinax primogenitus]|uniref:Scavenger mRNA decapping enzyme n=1 Tax=Dacryopinax primogenitus (strain DJM 731) TaxID=1858805 RepID=M5GB24_DACPD|nr:scavenger mRNA decapping enzyme [Dacryopinax primogenitus]EJU06124.1 scavenger mRNA decapping enzyme [Dacryopinax primogenitus]
MADQPDQPLADPETSGSPIDLSLFTFTSLLNEDPRGKTINLLGTYPSSKPSDSNGTTQLAPAVLLAEKTHFDKERIGEYVRDGIGELQVLGVNDIYNWLLGWAKSSTEAPRDADVKITLIRDASETHIRKYSKQEMRMVHETPEVYRSVVLPYIDALPRERIQWVYNILEGKSEEPILSSTPTHVLLPDMKWDQNPSSLYLTGIFRDPSLRSIRDLWNKHVGMLKDIRADARRVVKERWDVEPGELRIYFHYLPSYYHLHVHITRLTLSIGGMYVGHAHLLDDVISLLELDKDDALGIMQNRTLTYVLGEQNALYERMVNAQVGLEA